MSDDRAEQVRRLAQAMAVRGVSFQFYEHLAAAQYDAGARIPAPPAPVMPVVSEEAARVAHAAYHKSRGTDAHYYPLSHQDMPHWQAELRAAWPILLRDSVAALPDARVEDRISYFRMGKKLILRDTVLAVCAALGAAPDGA